MFASLSICVGHMTPCPFGYSCIWEGSQWGGGSRKWSARGFEHFLLFSSYSDVQVLIFLSAWNLTGLRSPRFNQTDCTCAITASPWQPASHMALVTGPHSNSQITNDGYSRKNITDEFLNENGRESRTCSPLLTSPWQHQHHVLQTWKTEYK